LIVIKRNSSREAFDRDKLARAVFTALRKRPIESERAERMITGIIRRLEATGDTEIASKTIGEMVMESLITLDPVAYVRFASVYKDFKNVQDFEKFLTSIEEQPKGN